MVTSEHSAKNRTSQCAAVLSVTQSPHHNPSLEDTSFITIAR